MNSKNKKYDKENIQIKSYPNGQTAVYLHERDGLPLAELSLMQDSVDLAPDEFIFKDYSENTEITQDLLNLNLISPTSRFVLIGTHVCSICKIS